MTRKDYELIAKALYQRRLWLSDPDNPDKMLAHNGTVLHIADALASDNPRFDRARFLKACGVQ